MLQPGLLFDNRYELTRLLGRGGFAEVWLVNDTLTGLEEALKIYAPGGGMDEDGVKIFTKELAVVHDLRHTNLLTPKTMGQYDRQPYLILPYCPNGSLNKQIGQCAENEARKILEQVAAGLTYLHNRKIVHQDIKPDNILVDANHDYVITDFGISLKAQSTLRKSVRIQANSGTMAYMAPERFSAEPHPIPANDIWSLGAMMFELVEGNVPFMAQIGGLAQMNGAQLPTMHANVSDEFKQLIASMLDKDAARRPTAEQLARGGNFEPASAKNEKKKQTKNETQMIGDQPRFCGACGASLVPNARFCPVCGHEIGTSPAKSSLPEAIFDIEELKYCSLDDQSFQITLQLDMPQANHAYAFFSFYYDDEPIVNFSKKDLPYGEKLLIKKGKNGRGEKSTIFDFNQTDLVSLTDDETIEVTMRVILSLHNDNNEYPEDVDAIYTMNVYHVSHWLRDDEWTIQSMTRIQ